MPTERQARRTEAPALLRSEEHTSELQSQSNLVCRLLLEKKTPHSSQAISLQPHALCRFHLTTLQFSLHTIYMTTSRAYLHPASQCRPTRRPWAALPTCTY